METARSWAEGRKYDYRVLGDELFRGIPEVVAQKAASKLPLTDIGRLLWSRRFLAEGEHDCVIWVDADVLVFDPDNFKIDVSRPELVCREVSVLTKDGGIVVERSYNPTVLSFRRDSALLPRWISACEGVTQRLPKLPNEAFGRPLLEALAKTQELKCIESVAHNTLDITSDIIKGQRQNIRRLVQKAKDPFGAANLSGHFPLEEDVFDQVVERLLADGAQIMSGKPAPK
ncbi:hypothetical protein IZ6_12020 [Terrihabitans soli]|uniref:Nucleotide-diphospho-sugar transferase domain-containing protein n=1 Tax=Terrihabitans soli TaxID=708113 RepID=A0A6S6QR82_9HYPH|nr:hypothetical protein [Terrihabitans soli]BCJ90467.1 hypothetical protein IZ6_12020 [Terrihabitans soli]